MRHGGECIGQKETEGDVNSLLAVSVMTITTTCICIAARGCGGLSDAFAPRARAKAFATGLRSPPLSARRGSFRNLISISCAVGPSNQIYHTRRQRCLVQHTPYRSTTQELRTCCRSSTVIPAPFSCSPECDDENELLPAGWTSASDSAEILANIRQQYGSQSLSSNGASHPAVTPRFQLGSRTYREYCLAQRQEGQLLTC